MSCAWIDLEFFEQQEKIAFYTVFLLHFHKPSGPRKISLVTTKNKIDNPVFVDEEDISMVHKDEDYDEYNTPNTSRIDETSFMGPDIQEEATSSLKVKRDTSPHCRDTECDRRYRFD